MAEDRTRRREIELKYYYSHREEILQKQKERRERNKNNNENDLMERCKRKSYEVKNNFTLISDENEKFLIYSVETLSGKQLGYEVRKRNLLKDEYGKDKWTFCDENQMKEWVKHH